MAAPLPPFSARGRDATRSRKNVGEKAASAERSRSTTLWEAELDGRALTEADALRGDAAVDADGATQ